MSLEELPKTIELLLQEKEGSPTKVALRVVDQRLLPHDCMYRDLNTYQETIAAIQNMTVRGAPVLGICGAAALVLWAQNESSDANVVQFCISFERVAAEVACARPTAINLSKGVTSIQEVVRRERERGNSLEGIKQEMIASVMSMIDEDERINRNLGSHGAALLEPQSVILTHCNAGSLATAFYGTALGVIYAAFEQNKIARVFVDETRPVDQGARLTAWELSKVGVPTVLICDSVAASIMASGEIDVVIVGADRICMNGDFANKIGTYALAVLAQHHAIPFYVAAPVSTIDTTMYEGSLIPIEQRAGEEVARDIPEGVEIYNPAFDVTTGSYVTSFITEKGVFSAHELGKIFEKEQ